jgi:DNA gyrase subunit B
MQNRINKGLNIVYELIQNNKEINKQNYEDIRKDKYGMKFIAKWELLNDKFNNFEELKETASTYNHRIVKVEIIEEVADVYDLTVPPYNNFALSAGIFVHNSAKNARYREFQAILPLWGKIQNTEKTDFDKMMDSEKIQVLIAALGAGVGKNFELKKLRYDKIILMADADDDGSHIRALLLTFFYNYMPEVLKEGMIYSACPPLYKVVKGKQNIYIMDDQGLKDYKAKNGNKIEVQRFKGLGEMNFEQLKETTMDPLTRTLKRITLEDAEKAANIFDICMGKKADLRREFIEANAYRVNLKFL